LDVQQQKQRLRENFLNTRTALSEAEYFIKSEEIVARLVKQPEFVSASTVHCYVSMEERREVNTKELIKKVLAQPKRLAVPVTDFETMRLKSYLLKRFEDLEKNKWGVLEPREGVQLSPREFDLVIVPMVGGDEDRNRIGYGKGFYDRFLSEVTCTTIGLSFECCIAESVPAEDFDVPLHKVITEERVIG